MPWREIDIKLAVRRVADLRRGIFSCQRTQLPCRGKYQRLIGGFVVSRNARTSGLRQKLGTSVQELDYVRHAKNVLVKSPKEENLIPLDGPADGASDLLLPVVRLERQECARRAQRTVAHVIEDRTVVVIRSRLGDHVNHSSSSAALFG